MVVAEAMDNVLATVVADAIDSVSLNVVADATESVLFMAVAEATYSVLAMVVADATDRYPSTAAKFRSNVLDATDSVFWMLATPISTVPGIFSEPETVKSPPTDKVECMLAANSTDTVFAITHAPEMDILPSMAASDPTESVPCKAEAPTTLSESSIVVAPCTESALPKMEVALVRCNAVNAAVVELARSLLIMSSICPAVADALST